MELSRDLRLTLLGFGTALGILALLFWVIGFEDTLAALAPADLSLVGLVILMAITWLFTWSLTLYIVLHTLDISVSVVTGALMFASAQFANNVTPFGQAGGEPLAALLISRTVDSEYETGLAAIASVDAINLFPSIALAVTGLTYYAVAFTLGPRLRQAGLVVLAILVIVPTLAYLGWRYRDLVATQITRGIGVLTSVVGRLLPGRTPPSSESIRARVENFYRDLERVASNRRGLLAALAFSAIGWLCLVGSLWLSLLALDHRAPVPAIFVIIPLASMASVAPLPGGLGTTDAILVVLLVSITAVTPATAAATVVLHRFATYWLPIGIGGGSALALGSEMRRSFTD